MVVAEGQQSTGAVHLHGCHGALLATYSMHVLRVFESLELVLTCSRLKDGWVLSAWIFLLLAHFFNTVLDSSL